MDWYAEEFFCHDLPTRPRPELGVVLVTGATGYIGGRLVPELQERGYRVRIMVRSSSPEQEERWPDAVRDGYVGHRRRARHTSGWRERTALVAASTVFLPKTPSALR